MCRTRAVALHEGRRGSTVVVVERCIPPIVLSDDEPIASSGGRDVTGGRKFRERHGKPQPRVASIRPQSRDFAIEFVLIEMVFARGRWRRLPPMTHDDGFFACDANIANRRRDHEAGLSDGKVRMGALRHGAPESAGGKNPDESQEELFKNLKYQWTHHSSPCGKPGRGEVLRGRQRLGSSHARLTAPITHRPDRAEFGARSVRTPHATRLHLNETRLSSPRFRPPNVPAAHRREPRRDGV
jgi:hypothetical protein